MAQQTYGPETLVLDVVNSEGSVTMEQLLAKLPQLSWNQVFHSVDALSRHGGIRLRRKGGEYEVTLPG